MSQGRFPDIHNWTPNYLGTMPRDVPCHPQLFTEYGLWQDFGTGKEIPRGNHGEIGRVKKRVAKKWFSRKYYSSVLNLRDFLADNIGQSFVGLVAKALDDNYRRYNH